MERFDNNNFQIDKYLQEIEEGNSELLFNLAEYYNFYEHDISNAIKYYKLGVEKKVEMCYIGLAEYYKMVENNIDEALIIWNKGIEEISSTKCMLKIAIHYKNIGQYEEAIKYYTMCFDQGDVIGIWQLGLVYWHVIKDYAKMKECLIKAIKCGDINSSYCLGVYYRDIENYDVMKKYFIPAIEKNHPLAIYDLGNYYEFTENNTAMAIKYYLKGVKLNDKKCTEALERLNYSYFVILS